MSTRSVVDASSTFPLSSQQREIWLDQSFEPDSPGYNFGACMSLEGPLDEALLERALDHVIQTNDAFRLQLVEAEPLPRQRVVAHRPWTLTRVDFSGQEEAEARAWEWMNTRRRQLLPLFTGPLFDVALLKVADQRHICFLLVHHLIADVWAITLVIQRMAQAYNALLSGQPLPDAPEPSSLEIVASEEAYEHSERHARDAAYWREVFASLPEPLPRSTWDVTGVASASHSATLELSREFFTRLESFARGQKASAAQVILGALYGYFTRTAQHEDLAVGLSTRNRFGERAVRTVAMCTNTVVAWYRLGTQLTFSQLLREMEHEAARGAEHRRFPLADTVRWARQAHKTHAQLFDIRLSYMMGACDVRLGEATLRLQGLSGDLRQQGLALHVEHFHAEGPIPLQFHASTSFISPRELERLVQRFQVLLEDVLERPDVPLSQLRLLPEDERQRLLVDFNRTATPPTGDTGAHHLFEAQAARRPHAPALVFDDGQRVETLTYRELDERANQLAHLLRSRGVGPEVLVGLLLERSLEQWVCMLGVLKAGGAWLPLDPAYPQARLDFMREDARPALVLTQASLREDAAVLAAQPRTAPALPVQAQQLAYVIYTSGSAGKPKGVLVPHEGLCNVIRSLASLFQPDPDERALQFASFSFDGSLFEAWMALGSGATLYLGSRDTLAPGRPLQDFLERHRIHSVSLTPSTLATLSPSGLSALRHLCVAGEACPEELVRQWSPGRRFFNIYGPTEATIWSTAHRCELEARPPPIGRPIPNTQAYVLDAHGQLTPRGVAGELYVGGVGVARGYLGRPELTAERFVPNPFGAGRLYRTGDRVRWNEQGELEFLGRLDEQVKLRGFRIEVGEVEQALGAQPGVREARVRVRTDARGEPCLTAYVVARAQEGLVAALRQAVKERLPEYMVPGAWVVLEALPLTPHGKLDIQALPAPTPQRAETVVAPRTPTEKALAAVWREVLGVSEVSVRDDFFALGGHSLLATRLLSRLRELLGVELPLRFIFQQPTLEALAAGVDQAQLGLTVSTPRSIRPASRVGPLPATFMQQQMWVLDQLGYGGAYIIPVVMRLRGPLQRSALEQAVEELVRRHEVLRTTFHSQEGQVLQRIHPPGPVAWVTDRLPALEPEAREAALHRWLEEQFQRPFDLECDPMLRAGLLHLGEQETVLLLVMHHIASDGWSMGVLGRELSALYGAFREGKPSPLPELTLQLADVALWQREGLSGDRLAEEVAYWRQQLAGAPQVLELPLAQTEAAWRAPEERTRGAQLVFHVEARLTGELRALARRSGVTLFMALLGAFQTLLAREAGQEELLVGTPVAGRTREELEPLIGYFINTLVLRADLSGQPTFLDVLERTRRTALAAFAHQELPFEKLVEELGAERVAERTPLVQVLFALQNAAELKLELPGLEARAVELRMHRARMDLEVDFFEEADGLRCVWGYHAGRFEAETMERMVGHFQALLERLVREPQRGVWEVPLMAEAERRQLLLEWSGEDVREVHDTCVHRLFERQVERTPDAVALVLDTGGDAPFEQLTYRELNLRANQLAHALRARGVGAESLVALVLERSLQTVVGMLGVLKAGGAYVPLDPDVRPERLALLLEDMRPHVVLTQRGLSARLPATGLDVLRLDAERLDAWPGTDLEQDVALSQAAYVLYTSGSTGRPKGVIVEHDSLVAHCTRYQRFYSLRPDDRVLLVTVFHFDPSVEQLYPALMSGATVVLSQWEPEPRRIAERLHAQRITRMGTSGAIWRELTAQWLADPELARDTPLRGLVVGGDAMPAQGVSGWRATPRGASTRLFNAYGPTEATVTATVHEIDSGFDERRARIPIGRPLAERRVYVLDAHRQPVPVGVVGELYIGGAGVARGYLNAPELTREKFLALRELPFAAELPEAWLAHPRVYRTGDRVRWLPDGTLDFLGRVDKQVKIRGYRVELGEVESALRRHPEVADAVVLVREQGLHRDLAAYVVAKTGGPRAPGETEARKQSRQEVLVAALRRSLQERLPEHMVPGAWVMLETMPLTPQGKPDVRALPAPGEASARPAVAPRTPTEALLLRLWSEVLGRSVPSIHDSFFELGGHSLMAVRLMSRIHDVFQRRLPVSTLFQHPTVDSQAWLLNQAPGGEVWTSEVALQPHGTRPPLFCMPGLYGDVLYLHALVRHLGAQRPLYGLQPVGLDGVSEPLSTREALVERYLEDVLRVSPRGPYLLAGHSFGGEVALALAEQLVRRGERVRVVLFDTLPPGLKMPRPELTSDPAVMEWMMRRVEHTAGLDLSEERARLDGLEFEEQLRLLSECMERAQQWPPGTSLQLLRGKVNVARAQLGMHMELSEPLPVPVLLFVAEQTGHVHPDMEASWSRLLPLLRMERAEGGHEDLLSEPRVRGLVEKLVTQLDAWDETVSEQSGSQEPPG